MSDQSNTYAQPPQQQEPPRKRRHVLRWITLSSLALCALIVLVTVLSSHGGQTSVSSSPSSSPSTSAPAAPSAPAAAPSTPSGPVQLRAGDSGNVTIDGATAGTLTVGAPTVSTSSPQSYGEPPANGHYVVFKVTAHAAPAYHDGWFVSPLDFHLVQHGQHYDEGNGNAYLGMTDAQSGADLSSTLAAGESTTGYLAFDVPSAHGQLVYAPNSDGQPLAVWSW